MMEEKKWYSMDISKVCEDLKTSTGLGLEAGEASGRMKSYGPNTLQEQPPRSIISMFLGQMKEALVLILAAAAVISG
ncbi:MAG: cation-transporting P-type ATPase, partial [Desulfocucumaceae bacterium]